MKLMLCAAIGTAHWMDGRSYRPGPSKQQPCSARAIHHSLLGSWHQVRPQTLRAGFHARLEARSMLPALPMSRWRVWPDVRGKTNGWDARAVPAEVQYGSAAIQRRRVGAIMTIGRPKSYPPTQALLEAVWCRPGYSRHGVPDRSCRFCRTSFPQVEGLWKCAVGYYICGDAEIGH
jgi:hypothetical protein